MCDTCGCNITHGNAHLVQPGGRLSKTDDGHEAVTVLKNLLHANDHAAAHNREHFNKHGILAINLMSSPGAGKTSLLEATIDALKDEFSIAVDPVTTMRIEDVLKQLKHEMTIVLVTNLVQQARRLADRTAFFLGGECVEVAPTEDLFTDRVQDPRTRDYVEGRFG